MHRPPSSRRRSTHAPQLCALTASLLLLLSLSLLYIRLSSHHSTPLPNDATHSTPITHDRIDDPLLLDDDQKPLTPPPSDAAQNLFWDHALAVARISFHRTVTTPSHTDRFARPDPSFGSDDEPVDEAVRAKLASIRSIEDALFIGDSLLRDGWAKWLEGKGDFIKRDRMLRSDHREMLNPRNHVLLQDPDVAGLSGLTRGDRMMQKAVLRDEVDLSELEMEGRRSLREKKDEGFSGFVDRFFDGGLCSIRVFMVWNSASLRFGVRHRRGVESVLYHDRNACVLLLSETVEMDFFEEFVNDG